MYIINNIITDIINWPYPEPSLNTAVMNKTNVINAKIIATIFEIVPKFTNRAMSVAANMTYADVTIAGISDNVLSSLNIGPDV